ncbi:hypothetical protein ACHAXS_009484 [Conticribra weissflogii]
MVNVDRRTNFPVYEVPEFGKDNRRATFGHRSALAGLLELYLCSDCFIHRQFPWKIYFFNLSEELKEVQTLSTSKTTCQYNTAVRKRNKIDRFPPPRPKVLLKALPYPLRLCRPKNTIIEFSPFSLSLNWNQNVIIHLRANKHTAPLHPSIHSQNISSFHHFLSFSVVDKYLSGTFNPYEIIASFVEVLQNT